MPLRIRATPAGDLMVGAHRTRRQASIPTLLARKGYWQPGRGKQRVDGIDFLGVCRANGTLSMADLDVLCWLCERYRETRPRDGTVRQARPLRPVASGRPGRLEAKLGADTSAEAVAHALRESG